MHTIELMSIIAGVVLAVLGVVGGLLTLPTSIRTMRKALLPHGNKGVGFCVVSREDRGDATIFTVLVVEDLFHFLGGMAKPESGARIQAIEQVGEYYKVVMALPQGRDYFITKTKMS